MKKLTSYLLAVSSYITLSSAFAQTRDAWSTIKLERKITKPLTVFFNQEYRFNENITELGLFFYELGAEYKINKAIKIAGAYRYLNKRRLDDTYNSHSRYYGEITFKQKFKPLVLMYRIRFQSQLLDFIEKSNKTVPTNNLRNKVTVKWDLGKRYTPYISGEVFYQLTNNSRREFDRVRYYVGIDYEINKRSEAGIYYLLQREFNVVDPTYDYVFGITYTRSF